MIRWAEVGRDGQRGTGKDQADRDTWGMDVFRVEEEDGEYRAKRSFHGGLSRYARGVWICGCGATGIGGGAPYPNDNIHLTTHKRHNCEMCARRGWGSENVSRRHRRASEEREYRKYTEYRLESGAAARS